MGFVGLVGDEELAYIIEDMVLGYELCVFSNVAGREDKLFSTRSSWQVRSAVHR